MSHPPCHAARTQEASRPPAGGEPRRPEKGGRLISVVRPPGRVLGWRAIGFLVAAVWRLAATDANGEAIPGLSSVDVCAFVSDAPRQKFTPEVPLRFNLPCDGWEVSAERSGIQVEAWAVSREEAFNNADLVIKELFGKTAGEYVESAEHVEQQFEYMFLRGSLIYLDDCKRPVTSWFSLRWEPNHAVWWLQVRIHPPFDLWLKNARQ